MNYKDKYIKYKTKYLELKNISIEKNYILEGGSKTYQGNKTYQEIIYDIAQHIKPEFANKFKKEFGLKQLTNQVIELNKYTFLNDLENKITNYYITDKVDGIRTILYLTPNISYAINNNLSTIDFNSNNTNILDTEYYSDTNTYYIFDIMVYEGKNLTKQPFKERMSYFDKFDELYKFVRVKTKSFIKLGTEWQKQIKKFSAEPKPYQIDGIIFTPDMGLYNSMKVYKYKSIKHLTIDFLIKKCPVKLLEQYPYSLKSKKNKTLYLLFCGISKQVFFKLRMRTIKFYSEIFPNIHMKNLPQYFPIQFEPSSKKYAYLFVSEKHDLDNEVGEFGYDTDSNIWELKKIRTDRKVELERGNYFGNNYKIAESIWMNYQDPLIIGDIKPKTNTNTDIYFQEHNNILQKASRNYNSFVKSQIFDKFKGTDWVMDLASGKGQDLFRYSVANMKNIIFLEKDKVALEELIERKHLFSKDAKYKNQMNVLVQNVDLLDHYKKIIGQVNNISIKRQQIDLIVCNFAFHYMVRDVLSLENICKLIDYYLKPNGKFVFTSFDGNKIIDLLENNNGEWIVKSNDKIKYGIIKKYSKNILEEVGQKIDVLLPFSKDTFYEEYLINIDFISKELDKYNIKIETNESFSQYLNKYSGTLDKNDELYTSLYHYYIFVKK
jgi:hypothetical protein